MKQLVFGGVSASGLAGLRNLDTVAAPSVTWRDGRWWMVLGGTSGEDRVIRLFSAESTAAESTAAGSGWRTVTEPDDPGLAVGLADASPSDARNATGFHCPSYVRGLDETGAVVERIYYASAAGWESLYGPYRIGLLQWEVRLGSGTSSRSSQPRRHGSRTGNCCGPSDATPWHDAGAWKPAAATDKDDLVVFFTVAQRDENPYVPSLGIGSLRLSRGLR
jgi:hypothetical protein